MNKDEIIENLTTDRPAALFGEADRVRRLHVGREVHLRGLIEISNACGRDCVYCGLRRSNPAVARYRMSVDEIFSAAKEASAMGFKSLVLQSGENCQYPLKDMCGLLVRIKSELNVAITLSLGEKKREEYAALIDAGADRYLLRFETSNEQLFQQLKPDSSFEARMQCLQWLKELGFQVGSGIMVGLPGQTIETMADDISLLNKLDLDMIGIGPFIANPQTPLGALPSGSLNQTLRAVAILRIMTKNAHIPATTAMGSIEKGGREKALQCGANVLMPNVTPTQYREQYQLYPNKICIHDQPSDSLVAIQEMLSRLDRPVATTYGHSLKRF